MSRIPLSIVIRSTDLAMRALRLAAQSPAHPTYEAFARIGLALFQPGDDKTTLEALQEASRYAGRHRGIVHTVVAWIIITRYSARPEFAAILEQHPLGGRVPDSLAQQYPKTAALLRKR